MQSPKVSLMLRARTLIISLGLAGIVGIGSVLVALVSSGMPAAEAQRATTQGPIRIAVVDFTRLSRDLADVEKIRDLMGHLDELRQIEERYWRDRIRLYEREIETAESFNLQEDLEEFLQLRREAQAYYDAAQQVAEFRMRKLATMYSSRLLQKILEVIESHSDGRFDIVFKVLGDPGDATVGEDLVGDAQKLNLAQAREVLFYDAQSEYITDITEQVRRRVNQPADADDVSRALDDQITRVREEIREMQARD